MGSIVRQAKNVTKIVTRTPKAFPYEILWALLEQTERTLSVATFFFPSVFCVPIDYYHHLICNTRTESYSERLIRCRSKKLREPYLTTMTVICKIGYCKCSVNLLQNDSPTTNESSSETVGDSRIPGTQWGHLIKVGLASK